MVVNNYPLCIRYPPALASPPSQSAFWRRGWSICCPVDDAHRTVTSYIRPRKINSGRIKALTVRAKNQMFRMAHWELKRAQPLRALAALEEDPGSVPSTRMVLTTNCTSSFRVSDTLFWPPWPLHRHGAHIYMQIDTLTHKNKSRPGNGGTCL